RMEQPAGGLRLTQQAALPVLDLLRPADQAHCFDREPALDLRVLGEEHLAHGAGAQEIQDAVAADHAADGIGGIGGHRGATLLRPRRPARPSPRRSSPATAVLPPTARPAPSHAPRPEARSRSGTRWRAATPP